MTNLSDSEKTFENSGQNKKAADIEDICELILESLPLGIIAFDKNLKIINSNSMAKKLIHIENTIDESLEKGTDSQVWGNWQQRIQNIITENKKANFENINYRLNNKTILLNITCTPIQKNSQNQTVAATLAIEDITEKVNMQRQLASAERLAAVGKLASKVAHELNNPMDGILRYINLTIRAVEQAKLEKPKEYLNYCRTGLMRMVQIISELLEFSRSTHSAFELLRIDKLIDDAIKALENQASSSNVKILTDYDKNTPKIRAANLYQVFFNLIKNSIDAMETGGQLHITTKLENNDTLLITFKDTGPGFDQQNAQAIFEPFFTTKTKGKGTGLGLAICKDIIEKYSGTINAQNCPDAGCVFSIKLPLDQNNYL